MTDYLFSFKQIMVVYYSKVPIISPPVVLVESGLNNGQVSLMRPICFEKCILVQTKCTNTNGLISEGGLNFEWSLSEELYCIYNHIKQKMNY